MDKIITIKQQTGREALVCTHPCQCSRAYTRPHPKFAEAGEGENQAAKCQQACSTCYKGICTVYRNSLSNAQGLYLFQLQQTEAFILGRFCVPGKLLFLGEGYCILCWVLDFMFYVWCTCTAFPKVFFSFIFFQLQQSDPNRLFCKDYMNIIMHSLFKFSASYQLICCLNKQPILNLLVKPISAQRHGKTIFITGNSHGKSADKTRTPSLFHATNYPAAYWTTSNGMSR